MTGIDAAILDLTEKFCRRIQRLTGRTNVWLAVQLTNLSIILYFAWAAFYFRDVPGRTRVAVGLFCVGVLYGLSRTVFRVSIETSETYALHRVSKGLRNPRRIRDAPLRISFLTLSGMLLFPVLVVSLNRRVPVALQAYPLVVLTTVVLYVLACDPLPFGLGKVTERLRSTHAHPVESPSDIPVV